MARDLAVSEEAAEESSPVFRAHRMMLLFPVLAARSKVPPTEYGPRAEYRGSYAFQSRGSYAFQSRGNIKAPIKSDRSINSHRHEFCASSRHGQKVQ